ncbi:hypothetical protein PJF56_15675 [Roseofilum sp. BLCC_M91]|uniref:Uncharacterized protein n=1 Tax=Roseofilum halophilum BLCC-M91 TaxID=3022259 RepID=A0ABT7BP32_9CYAN|nr:hypothetical protein [Roseofilum halophilum]MDJ1180304.1 hypothetical protein [Roseofilum halophilum BLCC-M91]
MYSEKKLAPKPHSFISKIAKNKTIIFLFSTVLLTLLILKLQNSIDPGYLTRDPSAILEAPFYIGIISNIGILMWCASTSICFFTFAITRNHSTPMMSSFLLGSGAINCLLLFDDFFLLHEEVFPNYLYKYLYTSEKRVVVIYLIFGLWYALKNRKTILKTRFSLLIIAISCFLLSVVCDQTTSYFPEAWIKDGTKNIIEDGFKLLGIVSFIYYYINFCFNYINQLLWDKKEGKMD